MLVNHPVYHALFLFLAGSLNIAGYSTGFAEPEGENTPPNVLLILVDDLKPALGAYGDDLAITPALDRLSEKGMRFDRAYANQAVCAPSRYNLMLGSRSTSTGIYDFGRNFRDFYPDAVTLPQHFMQHGYHTESMGKVFHIGHNTYNDEDRKSTRLNSSHVAISYA